MKAAVTLLALLFAACEMDSPPETATVEQHATTITRALPEVNTTCQWVTRGTCYGQVNDGNNLWPAGMGITSVQVLVRSGPDRLEHKQPTFLAFVVWNSTAIGRIFRLDLGSADAANWRATLDNIVAVRTTNLPDTQAGSTGSTIGGPGPIPHPNVDGFITVDAPYLDVVRKQATAINDATTAFLGATASFD